MVETTKIAAEQGYTNVCVYTDTMEHMPQLQTDIENAGGKVELVRSSDLLRDIWRLYRKYRPTVVDTHFMNKVKLWTYIFSLLFGARHYTHMHSLLGDDIKGYVQKKGNIKRILLGIYYWTLTKLSKRVFCISQAIMQQYRKWSYGDCSNVETLYIGTQLVSPKYTQEEARNLLKLPHDRTIITNISAIEHIKGIDLIINAVAKLKQKGLDVLFVHIGGLRSNTIEQQQYADSLKQLVTDLDVIDNMVWLGRRSDVHDILPMADIYVHPSRSEGLGSVLLEASVAGLPLVGSRVGGIPEIVHDQENGLLVDTDNAEQVAYAIEQLPSDAKNYGDQAREMVYQHFDQTKQADILFQRYIDKF
jgi:glycosyltransferase involved in cell wall biosynthesis